MHCLTGTFIDELPEECSPSGQTVHYPIKIRLPPNKTRIFYFETLQEQQKWASKIKDSIGYSNLFDYYILNETLGKGQFGLVKLATHKKTGL
jgi:hypothetical protein